ncbi:conserved Plasmodium protein, unknown function [Plasmodium malariae]|uniref:Uncharacterized protein n=1 Tax=Plasmodium malariae TaxID=5858 RepID=A0A1D3TE40_PLAMA|nr:conserved Plasmodium protein, unknown function [Plasmodium malariae]SCP03214.1 conserved Plasmodium protein, unknown function [Plasmodium malariae]
MEEKIKSHLKALNFVEVCNCIDKKETEIGDIAKWVCYNKLLINIKLLEKCSENTSLKQNILDELDNEIIKTTKIVKIDKKDKVDVYLCIKRYVFLLYKILSHFEKVNLETNKMVYEVFLIFSIKLVILYDEKEFLLNIIHSLVNNVENNKKKNNSQENLFLFEFAKNLFDLYCFIMLPDFIFLHSLLIYLYNNINMDICHNLKNERIQLICYILKNINILFEKLLKHSDSTLTSIYDDEKNDRSSLLIELRDSLNIIYPKTECLVDTISKSNTKIIFKECNYFHLLYKTIQISFNTNKYSLEKEKYHHNYNYANVNINNFLLLLKILSPNFLVWTARKDNKEKIYKELQQIIYTYEETEFYKFNYIYVIDNLQNYNYLNETTGCLFFFYLSLLSLNEINKNLDKQINILVSTLIGNYFSFFQRRHNFVLPKDTILLPNRGKIIQSKRGVLSQKNEEHTIEQFEDSVFHENTKNDRCMHVMKEKRFSKNVEAYCQVKEQKKNTHECTIYDSKNCANICKISFDILFKHSHKIIMKLKNLIIWGYIYPDDSEELNFLNLANIFIFNDDMYTTNQKKESLSEYLFKRHNFFIYNYSVFKNTYECKTLSYKYMDVFSDFISSLILNIILVLAKIHLSCSYILQQDSEKGDRDKTQLNRRCANVKVFTNECVINDFYCTRGGKLEQSKKMQQTQQEPLITKDETNVNTNDTNSNIRHTCVKVDEETSADKTKDALNKLKGDIINSYYHIETVPVDERMEFFFNELLFICFKLINYPSKNVRKYCISVISLVIPKINIKSSYINYVDKKTDTFITFIDDDETYDQSEVIKNYVYLKCKINKYLNLNLIKSIEKLIRICFLKLSNRNLCSIICKNILFSFCSHPFVMPFILHKYVNIILYLIETNYIILIVDSLKCLFMLYQINAQDMKIYNYDIVYRLHLLFNVFQENNNPHINMNDTTINDNNLVINNHPSVNSNNLTSFLKKFYFNINQVDKGREEILLHIKLILHCLHINCSEEEYFKLIRIFSKHPKEFQEYSKSFQLFSAF